MSEEGANIFPVFSINMLMDESGKHIEEMGLYTGKIEDILREINPQFGVMISCIESQKDFDKIPEKFKKEGIIKHISSKPRMGIDVKVWILPGDDSEQFFAHLEPETKHEREVFFLMYLVTLHI